MSIRKWVSVCLPAVCALALPLSAGAQVFESVGIRAQGMGGAFVAVADDATATWWNPAGLANGAYFNSLLEWSVRADPAGMSARGFAVAYPALGMSYYRLALRDIRPLAPAIPASGATDDALSLFGATFGQSIGGHLVVASTVKIAHALGRTRGDLDIGAMAAAGPLRLGMTVRNLARPEFAEGGQPYELPRQVRVGIALNGGPSGHPDVTLAVDADLTTTPTPVGDARHVAGGLELWRSKRRFGVRGGVGMSTTGERRPFASLGTSLALRAGLFADFQVTRGQDDIRNGWGLGVRVTF